MTLSTVVDSGSIWLIDISRQLHSARLDGSDISAGQFPPQEWLPSNLSLTVFDVHGDVPVALQGKYDLVHVRLFLTVVKDNDPRPILNKMYRLLSQSFFCLLECIHLLSNRLMPLFARTRWISSMV